MPFIQNTTIELPGAKTSYRLFEGSVTSELVICMSRKQGNTWEYVPMYSEGGNDVYTKILDTGETVTISGSQKHADKNTIVSSNPENVISRKHCTLSYTPQGILEVIDYSKNGTTVSVPRYLYEFHTSLNNNPLTKTTL